MKTQSISLQKLGFAVIAAIFAMAAFASTASAESYYYPQQQVSVPYYYYQQPTTYQYQYQYQQPTQNKTQLIAYLKNLIAQLQALQSSKYGHSYGGYGLGLRYPNSDDYDIDVETENARNVEDDEATLYGEIDLDDAPYADVWFEYGEGGDLDEETDEERIDDNDDERFSIDVDGLDDDDRYYFRAVAEDPNGDRVYGAIKSFESDNNNSSSDDEPYADTGDVTDIEDDSAEISGEVDMNDFNNGDVFFVYGEDESQIEDVEDDYDSYSDVDEDGDDLQKVLVDSDLDSSDDYEQNITGLNEDEDYFYQICVGYEDDDDDDVIECGGVEEFTADDNGGSSNDDEPSVETGDASDIEDDSAEIRGEVDMNDFDNGDVFFVYGEDEDLVEDVEDEDSYSDVDEEGDDLQKYKVYDNLDGERTFWLEIYGLDDNTDHYYRICVEYEDEDDDDSLMCGDVEDFETD